MYSILYIQIRIYLIIAISVTICKREVIALANFVVRKPEKEVISMRIATDLLHTLDEKAKQYDISRNELINQMILFALANMEEPEKEGSMSIVGVDPK